MKWIERLFQIFTPRFVFLAGGPSHERMAEILRQADQIHLSPFLIRPFENDISCSANFPFDNGLLK